MARPEVTGKKLATRQAELPDHAGRVPLRLLTFKELKALKGVPYSRTQIRRLEQAGTFPMHVTLGDGDGAYIAWVEAEIDDYIVEKMHARPATPIDVVQACTDWDVYERAPKPDTRYVAYVDAASGTGKDSYALAIAHVEPDQTVVIDAVRERKPRFVPAQIIAEYSELLATYQVTEVHGDNYAAGFHSSEWSNHPTPFRPSKDSTSDNYLGALPVMLARRAHLLGPAIVRLSSKRMGISVGAQPSMAGIARARVMSALNGTDVAPWARPSPPKNPCRGGAGLGPPAKQLAPRARLPGSCFRYASGSCPPAAPFCQHIDEALLFPANGAESAHAA